MHFGFITILLTFFLSSVALAAPDTTNFQAHISKPDGTNLESNSVNFTFKYKNEAETCTLYVETYLGLNMTGSGGDVNILLGSGLPSFPLSAVSLFDVFDNRATINGVPNNLACVEGGVYTPVSLTEKRKIIVEFSYPGSNGTQGLPAVAINSVPYAMYASEAGNADSLGGSLAAMFVKFSDVTTCTGGNLLHFSGGAFSCDPPGAAVSFSGVLSGDVTGTQTATVISKIRGVPVDISAATPASGDVLRFNGTSWIATTGGGGGTVSSVGATLPISSTGGSTPTISITKAGAGADGYLSSSDWTTFNNKQDILSAASAGSSGYLTSADWNTFNSKLSSISSSDITAALPNVLTNGLADGWMWVGNGSNIAVARQISGDATIDNVGALTLATSGVGAGTYTKVTVDTKGRVTSGTQLTSADVTTALGYTPNSGGVTASYPLSATGTSTRDISLAQASASMDGYLSSSDWTTFNNKISVVTSTDVTSAIPGLITSLGVSSPLQTTGGTNPTLSMPAATATVNGYLSSADWTTFNNKLSSISSADITAALPNVLTSALVDGWMWVGNASGVAVARQISGDATIDNVGALTLSTSGVGAGTYTKVTVDTKGRVTVGAQLNTTDITTALAFTPVNRAGDTMTGALGIGGAPSASALLDLTSNTRGILIPRMTSTDRSAIMSPATGLQVYNTTSNTLDYYNGSSWESLGISGAGLTSLNGQSGSSQSFAYGTAGSDFVISSAGNVHTFNLPTASASNRGALSSADWTTFNNKQSTTLSNGNIRIGNGSNVAQERIVSGDATIDNVGALSLATVTSSATVGSANAVPTITYDAKGRITGSSSNAYQDATGASKGIVQGGLNVSITGGVISVLNANASTTGALTSTDWTTFNNKLSSITSADITAAMPNLLTTGLTNGYMWVGNGSGIAVARQISGDATINNVGGLVISNNAVNDAKINDVSWNKITSVPTASASVSGILSSSDFSSFASGASKWTQNVSGDIYRASGNVGIGTATPVAKLDVQGGAYTLGGNGDVNNSGAVTVSDMALVRNHIDGLLTLTPTEYARADVNGDGRVNKLDHELITKLVAGLITLPQAQHDFGKLIADEAISPDYLGHVGIGTRSNILTYALEVSGDVNVTGNFKMNGVNISSGTITGVTATAPLVATGTNTRDISLARATAGVDGFLASSDFTVFNNKISSQWTTSSDGTSVFYNGGNIGIGKSTPAASLDVLTVASQEPVLNLVSNGNALGGAGNFYGIKGLFTPHNGSNNSFGLSIELNNAVNTQSTAIYGKANGNTQNPSIGVHGEAIQPDLNGGAPAIGLKGSVSAGVAGPNGVTYGGYFENTATSGSYAYGLYVNSKVGAINAVPFAVAVSGDEKMRITGTGALAVGTNTPAVSALLDLSSTTRGMLIPRMTSADRTAIASPATGLQVYNTTSNTLDYYNGTSWASLGVSGSGLSSLNGMSGSSQSFAYGTAGSDFVISSAGNVHTFNLPTASAANRGVLSSQDFTTFNNKVSSQWTTSADLTSIFYTGGNVGIGTTTPTTEFMVEGNFGSGSTLATSGAGTRMFFYPRKSAFRSGTVTGSQWDDAVVGRYSVVMGNSSTASGDYSAAFGRDNVSSAAYSFTFGANNTASGVSGTAFGRNTTASGMYSTAMGRQTTSIGNSSTAMGYYSSAVGVYSTAAGVFSTAAGNYSTSLGYGNTTSGENSFAVGRYNTSDSYDQITVGSNNLPKGSENPSSWVLTDPLFVVGNGTSTIARSNALMILKNGNVGIGKVAPTYAVDVSGDVNVTGNFLVNGAPLNAGVGAITATSPLIATGTTTRDISLARATASVSGYLASSDFTTFNNKVSSQWTTSTDLTSVYYTSGNVGIGTSSPSSKLQVTRGGLYLDRFQYGDLTNREAIRISNDYFGNNTESHVLTVEAQTDNSQWLINGHATDVTVAPALGIVDPSNILYRSRFSNAAGYLTMQTAQDTIFQNGGVTESMRILANGRVGIGKSTPGFALDVSGDVNVTGNFKINGTNIGTGGTISGLTTGYLPRATSATTVSNSAVYDDGAGIVSVAGMLAVNGGIQAPSITTRGVGTRLILYPALSATTGDYALGVDSGVQWYQVPEATSGNSHKFFAGTTPLMTVRGDGYVGIGTTAPESTLDVRGPITGNNSFGAPSNAGLTDSVGDKLIVHEASTPYRSTIGMSSGGMYLQNTGGGSTNDGIHFYTGATTATEYMKLTRDGRLGVGVSAPNYAVDVSGDVNVTGNFKINGTNIGTGGTISGLTTGYIPRATASTTVANGSMFDDGAGKIGIGTATPTAQLEVEGTAASGANISATVKNLDATGGTSMSVKNDANVGAALSTYGSGHAGVFYRNAGAVSATNNLMILADSAVSTGGTHAIHMMTGGYDESSQIRMSVVGNGNVGIGTTNPSYKLDVNGDINANSNDVRNSWMRMGQVGNIAEIQTINQGAGNTNLNLTMGQTAGGVSGSLLVHPKNAGKFEVQDEGVPRLSVLQTGNVGIGTAAPSSSLHIKSANIAPTAHDANLRIMSSNSQGVDVGTSIGLGGNRTGTGNPALFGLISGRKESSTNSDNSGYLAFSTTDGSNNLTERMRITSTGGVGIGTASPLLSGLKVVHSGNGASSSSVVVEQNGVFGAGNSAYGLYSTATGVSGSQANIAGYFSATGASANYAAVFDQGNVGVGTTAPNAKLHIQGSTFATSTLKIEVTNPAEGAGIDLRNSTNVQGGMGIIGATHGVAPWRNSTLLFAEGNLNLISSWTVPSGGTSDINFVAGGYDPGANTRMTVKSDGRVGIGTTSPAQALDVVGNIQTSGCLYYASSSLGTCASDERIKKDIHTFDLGLDALMGINPVAFKYNGLAGFKVDGKEQLGVIAQDVEKVAPSLVQRQMVQLNPQDKDKTEIKVVDYGAFTYVMINAIKELYHKFLGIELKQNSQSREIASKVDRSEFNQLKAENEAKNKEITELKARLEKIEKALQAK